MKKILLIVISLSLLTFSCKKETEGTKAGTVDSPQKLAVTVSIAPQAYLIKRIAKDNIDVNVMVPPNVSPETYEPGPKRMTDLKNSRLYFSIGMPFEKGWLERVKDQFPQMTVVNMHRNIPVRSTGEKKCPHSREEKPCGGCKGKHANHDHNNHEGCGGKHEDHGHNHDHSKDPHVWTDPVILIQMAQNALTEILKIDSANREEYIKNHRELAKEIMILNDQMVDMFKDSKGMSFFVYHPAWGYFAERYGLHQVAIEVDGKEPSASEMAKTVQLIKEKSVKTIFIQEQFSDSVVKSIAEDAGITPVLIDPLEENVIKSIRKSAALIKEGLVK